MAAIHHPGMIPVYSCDMHTDGRPFYVMKYLCGESLYSRLHGNNRMTNRTALMSFYHACQTIAFAHKKGIVHLDLSSNNIMIGDFDSVRVVDWGQARLLEHHFNSRINDINYLGNLEDCGTDSSCFIGGTPEYLSPEQANCQHVDTTSDVFSLGAILCEILTGLPPYHGSRGQTVFEQSQNADLSDCYQRLEQSSYDSELINLAIHCLQKDKQDRPRDAIEVVRIMQAYMDRVSSDMSRFFDLSHDLYCIAHIHGYFLRINHSFQEALGYPETELLNKPFLNFIHPDDQERTTECMKALLEYKPVTFFRNRYITLDGNIIHLEWTAKRILNEDIVYAIAKVVE